MLFMHTMLNTSIAFFLRIRLTTVAISVLEMPSRSLNLIGALSANWVTIGFIAVSGVTVALDRTQVNSSSREKL